MTILRAKVFMCRYREMGKIARMGKHSCEAKFWGNLFEDEGVNIRKSNY